MAKIKISKICPNDHTLERLRRNELSKGHRERVLQHLEDCEGCARRVSEGPCEEGLVELIRKAGSTPALASAGALVEEIRRLWPGDEPDTRKDRQRSAKTDRPRSQREPDLSATLSGEDSSPDGGRLYDFLAPPQQPDELGRLGSYRALEVLGSGGMGVVFRAEDTLLRRQAALKVMLPNVSAGKSGRERFLREARAAASIKHDHIVTIYQVAEENGLPFIAMELLQGESLEKRLVHGDRLSAAEILHIGREIAEGLAAAHELKLVHRDIKPANIWLESRTTKAGSADEKTDAAAADKIRVKILDFGLACDTAEDNRLTRKGVIVGTAAYMCPEQARGQTPDARGDLFSLGSVLYVMCTLEHPYPGKDLISTLVSVVSYKPRHLGKLDPTLPADFADLVMQLLEKDPADRPQSAHEVAKRIAALEKDMRAPRKGVSKGTSLKTRPVEKETTPFWRRTSVRLSLAVVLAIMVGGGAWLAMDLFHAETPPSKIVAGMGAETGNGTDTGKGADPGKGTDAGTGTLPTKAGAGTATETSTGKGTLIIKAAYQIQLQVSKDNVPVALVALLPKTTKEIPLPVGIYDAELVRARDGLEFHFGKFTIVDGKKNEIEIPFSPEALDTLGAPKEVAPKEAPKVAPKEKGIGPPPPDPKKDPPKNKNPLPNFLKKAIKGIHF